jgi:hypothetical protein
MSAQMTDRASESLPPASVIALRRGMNEIETRSNQLSTGAIESSAYVCCRTDRLEQKRDDDFQGRNP